METTAKTLAVLSNSGSRLGLSALAASRPRRLVLCGLALILVAMCFLTPPFQSPDEHRHFFRRLETILFKNAVVERGVEMDETAGNG